MRSSQPHAVSRKPEAATSRPSGGTPRGTAAARSRRTAFSLIEVVAAVGIFAIGMVAVIGLFAPVAKSVGSLADAEAATNVAGLLTARLQGQDIAAVGKLMLPVAIRS